LYSPPLTATIIALSLLGAWLSASAGVLVSLRAATVRQAQQVLMITIMLLFGPVYGFQALPDAWRARLAGWLTAGGPAKPVIVVMALLTVIDLTLTVLAAARFQRARLTLS